jgi:hypothetical protein
MFVRQRNNIYTETGSFETLTGSLGLTATTGPNSGSAGSAGGMNIGGISIGMDGMPVADEYIHSRRYLLFLFSFEWDNTNFAS